jgi:hypothetical protein
MTMDDRGWPFRRLGLWLFEFLLLLYPPRFRREFAPEIRGVLLSRLREAGRRGGWVWLAAALQEIAALVMSILRERWHERRAQKEKTMVPENSQQAASGQEGLRLLAPRPAGIHAALWLAGWTLLTTAAIPAALFVAPPVTVGFIWLINLGAKAGFWPAAPDSILQVLVRLTSFALVLASVQWFLLRKFLPRVGLWFIATGAGVLIGGLIVALFLSGPSIQSWDPLWLMGAILLPVGLAIGLAQWMYLRRFLPHAFWIIFLDVLAAASILLAGGTFTSVAELMVLGLPGAITGLGLLLLLGPSGPDMQYRVRTEAPRQNDRHWPPLVRVGLALVALVPLFFACTWVYTSSQLALAKNEGLYSSPEQGMLLRTEKAYSPDRSVKILSAGPNTFDGSQPYIWYVIAEVRASSRADGSALGRSGCDAPGSYFLQTREGWVYLPEGAFPEFIGYWMKVYGWAGEGQLAPSTDWAPGQPKRFCQ